MDKIGIALRTYRRILELKIESWLLNDELNQLVRGMDLETFKKYYYESKTLENDHKDYLDSLITKKWKRISIHKGR
jgi:hypothetical protein